MTFDLFSTFFLLVFFLEEKKLESKKWERYR